MNVQKIISALVKDTKRRALKLEREFSISVDDIMKMWKQQEGCCAVTGIPLVQPNGCRHPLSPSLDRKDSSGGYTVKNTRLVSLIVNMAAFTWGLSYVDQLAIARTLKLIEEGGALYRQFKERLALVEVGGLPEEPMSQDEVKTSTESEGAVLGILGLSQNWFCVRRKLDLPLPTPLIIREYGRGITWRRYRIPDVLAWFKAHPEAKLWDPNSPSVKEELRAKFGYA